MDFYRMQQGKPTNAEDTNDGKSITEEQGRTPSTEQKDTNGHQVEDKE